MKRVMLAVAAIAVAWMQGDISAQAPSDQGEALRQQIEQRFDVLPLRDGIALVPRRGDRGVRSIEVSDSGIAVDGTVVTGGELRERLGDDAELVIRLSYLDGEARRRLFGRGTVAPERAQPVTPAPAPVPERDRSGRRGGRDRMRFGGDVVVAEHESLRGDAVSIGGGVRVDGEVTGNAVSIGGNMRLGPRANVLGDVVVIGGTLDQDAAARVGGSTVNVPIADFNLGTLGQGRTPFRPGSGIPSLFSLLFTFFRVAVLCVLASLVVMFARGVVERAGARASLEPLKAGAVGVLAQLLFLPLLIITIVVLVVTIVGIPLLALIPFGVLALLVVALLGFTAVAYQIGRLWGQRLAWEHTRPYATVILGVVSILGPMLIARLLAFISPIQAVSGALVLIALSLEYVAWTVGFGAVALTRLMPSSPQTMTATATGASA